MQEYTLIHTFKEKKLSIINSDATWPKLENTISTRKGLEMYLLISLTRLVRDFLNYLSIGGKSESTYELITILLQHMDLQFECQRN